jgi:hypothetical protein
MLTRGANMRIGRDGMVLGRGGAGAPPALWTPARLFLGGNTGRWYDAGDADTVTLNAGNVQQIDDKSGSTNHLTQTTSGDQPPYDAGDGSFNTALRKLMTCPTASVQTIFFVCYFNSYADQDRYSPVLGDSSTVPFHGPDAVPSPTVTDLIWESAANPTSVVDGSIYKNGNIVSPTASATRSLTKTIFGFSPTAAVNVSQVSRDRGFINRTTSLVVYELLMTTAALSTTDRQKAEGYLAHKHGLTGSLPSGHPYKTNPPTV